MRFELELRGTPEAVSGYMKLSCDGGERRFTLTDAPISSVNGALDALAEELEALLSPDEVALVRALGGDD